MPREILMPSLSPTMEEGKLAKWSKKEGDKVSSGDILAEIETDKAMMDYEALDDGIMGKILVAEGTEGVKVNAPIAILLLDGESKEDLKAYKMKSIESDIPKEQSVDIISINEEKVIKTVEKPIDSNLSAKKKPNKIFITPLARKIAKQSNIDIHNIKGSGPRGRIIKNDVLNFQPSSSSLSKSTGAEYQDIPNSSMRKVIATRLLESKNTIPHYYLTVDCTVNSLLEARSQINIKADGEYKISVNDFIIKAVALAMQKNPEANVSWQGENTRFYKTSDIAMAVSIKGGLVTPIIRNAESKGLVEISSESKALVQKAKKGNLRPSEYEGGSFTVSNLGMFGIKEFSAIINPPQSGILAVGGAEKRPVVVNNEIVIRNILTITLSADHRVLDGSVAALFLGKIKQYLENPVTMIL